MAVQPKPSINRNVFVPASLEGVMNNSIPDLAINIIQHSPGKDLDALKGTCFSIRNAVAISEDSPSYYKAKLDITLNTIPDLIPIAEEIFRLQNPGKAIDYIRVFQISCDILLQLCPEPVKNNPKNRDVKTFYTFENLVKMRDIVIARSQSQEKVKKFVQDGVVLDHDSTPACIAILYGFSHNLNPEKYHKYADFALDLHTIIEGSSVSDLSLLGLIEPNKNQLLDSVAECISRKYTQDFGKKLLTYLDLLSNLPEIPASFGAIRRNLITLALGDGAKRLDEIKALPEGDKRDEALILYCQRLLMEKKADQVREVADLCSNQEFKEINLQSLSLTLMKQGRTPEAKQLLSEEEFDQLDRDLNLQRRSDQFLKEGKTFEAKECYDQIQTPIIQHQTGVYTRLQEREFTTRQVRFECKWPFLFPLRIVDKVVYNYPHHTISLDPIACERTIPFAIWLGVAFVVYSITMNLLSKRYE